MDKKIVIDKKSVVPLLETRFVKVYDLQYEEGKHYYDATRRSAEDLVAVKSEDEIQNMLPDAVSCVVIMNPEEGEPQLLFSYEYRYPIGQFLLSVPAGLIDTEDQNREDALQITAIRELEEETGIVVGEGDEVDIINPCLFSTPGMTDESNALVNIILNRRELPQLSQEGAVGSELFDGFRLVNKEEARQILKNGRDENGIFYSVYTWMALAYFVGDLWK